MGAFPALKPGTGGKAPSMVKAVGGPHGEQPDMMREGYAAALLRVRTSSTHTHTHTFSHGNALLGSLLLSCVCGGGGGVGCGDG